MTPGAASVHDHPFVAEFARLFRPTAAGANLRVWIGVEPDGLGSWVCLPVAGGGVSDAGGDELIPAGEWTCGGRRFVVRLFGPAARAWVPAARAAAEAALRLADADEERAGLYEELGLVSECLAAIHEAAAGSFGSLDPRDAATRILARTASALGAGEIRAGAWLLTAEGDLEPECATGDGGPGAGRLGHGILGACSTSGGSVVRRRGNGGNGAGGDASAGDGAVEPEWAEADVAATAIPGRDGPIGALGVWRRGDGGARFDSRHVALVESMAAILGSVVENGRMVAEFVRTRVERREAEIAARIQESLLFAKPPEAPEGFEFAVVARPARSVGGDFFDFHRQGSGVFDVLAGDVMGKGAPAALIAAVLKGHFLRYAAADASGGAGQRRPFGPAEILSLVHGETVARMLDLEVFATVCLARFDAEAGTMAFADGGHPSPLHFRAATGEVATLRRDLPPRTNLPLGMFAATRYEAFVAPLEPGDAILFHSDGATEAARPGGERFGEERLREAFLEAARLPARVAAGAVLERALAFAGGALRDDATLLLVRVLRADERARPPRRIEIRADRGQLARVRDFVAEACRDVPSLLADPERMFNLRLAVVESVTNIVRHGCRNMPGGRIEIEIDASEDRVAARIRDNGVEFHPSGAPEPVLDGTQETGYGVYLVRRVCEKIEYGRDPDGMNRLDLVLRAPERPTGEPPC